MTKYDINQMNEATSFVSLYLTFLVNKSSMLQIKIVELQRPHLVSSTLD